MEIFAIRWIEKIKTVPRGTFFNVFYTQICIWTVIAKAAHEPCGEQGEIESMWKLAEKAACGAAREQGRRAFHCWIIKDIHK